MPPLAESGKWTKTGPAVDYFMRLLCPIPILRLIWGLAFVPKSQKARKAKADAHAQAAEVPLSTEEQSWLELTQWHEVASKRINRGGQMGSKARNS